MVLSGNAVQLRRGPGEGGLPTHRIVPGGEQRTTGSRRSERAELRTSFEEALSREAAISNVGDGYFVDEHVHDKHVCHRRRGKECERLGVSTVSLMS